MEEIRLKAGGSDLGVLVALALVRAVREEVINPLRQQVIAIPWLLGGWGLRGGGARKDAREIFAHGRLLHRGLMA
jgi:hypothetical protein